MRIHSHSAVTANRAAKESERTGIPSLATPNIPAITVILSRVAPGRLVSVGAATAATKTGRLVSMLSRLVSSVALPSSSALYSPVYTLGPRPRLLIEVVEQDPTITVLTAVSPLPPLTDQCRLF